MDDDDNDDNVTSQWCGRLPSDVGDMLTSQGHL